VKYKVRVPREVRDELIDAATYYIEHDAPDAAERLTERTEATWQSLDTMPGAHRLDQRTGFRFAKVTGFPYLTWFNIVGNTVRVLALAHTARSTTTVLNLIHGTGN
jgi:plasmid stabilization system protein ParE